VRLFTRPDDARRAPWGYSFSDGEGLQCGYRPEPSTPDVRGTAAPAREGGHEPVRGALLNAGAAGVCRAAPLRDGLPGRLGATSLLTALHVWAARAPHEP